MDSDEKSPSNSPDKLRHTRSVAYSVQLLVTVPLSSASPDLPRNDGNQLTVCWYECFCTNFC